MDKELKALADAQVKIAFALPRIGLAVFLFGCLTTVELMSAPLYGR